MHSKVVVVPREKLDELYFNYLGSYKIAIIILNIAPTLHSSLWHKWATHNKEKSFCGLDALTRVFAFGVKTFMNINNQRRFL